MAHEYNLDEGALRRIMKGENVENPIMQVLGTKRISSGNNDKDRYRLLLSDGKYLISFAMLTTSQTELADIGEIQTNSIIQIKRYITSVINNTDKGHKRVLVILDLKILVPGSQASKIGNPETLSDVGSDEPVSSSNSRSIAPSMNAPSSTMPPVRRPVDLNSSLQDALIHPISSLSPYQNKWVIRARVANKSSIRTWSNSRGEGKLFSMDLIDESGEIRATAFKEQVDKFYDKIEIDKVYYFSKAQIKMANKQFSNLNNDYEMAFIHDTIVEECNDADSSEIPQTKYDFTNIQKISCIETNSFIDVIGICKSAEEVQTIQARSTGRELKKREVTLVDQSDSAITLTLWGTEAENFDGSSQPVIAIKGARVGEFGGGKNISVLNSSILKINPDLQESHRLRGWFDNGGNQTNITNISARSATNGLQTPWLSFKEIADQQQSVATDRGEYFQVKATVLLFRSENCVYKACPADSCKKKVVDQQNGMYRCEKCGREYPNFIYRLLGSVNLGDWSSNQWVSMFAEEAEKVLGMTSQQVGECGEQSPEAITELADKANFKQFIVKCRAKMDTYNDEQRFKVVALRVDPVNYRDYNRHLISRIEELINN